MDPNPKNNSEITLEALARIVKEGFDNTPTTADISLIRNDVEQFRSDVTQRLDRIEKVLLASYDRRIARIEEALNISSK